MHPIEKQLYADLFVTSVARVCAALREWRLQFYLPGLPQKCILPTTNPEVVLPYENVACNERPPLPLSCYANAAYPPPHYKGNALAP